MNDQQSAPAAPTADEKLARFPILQHFDFDHLPEPLRSISARFHALAHELAELVPTNAESSVAFRKLLEAKDAGVRSLRHKSVGGQPR